MTGALARVGAIIDKEFRHLRRDPRIVGAALVLPIIQLLLFAYAVSFDVSNIATVVVDRDRSVASREYIDRYTTSGLFDVRGEVGSEMEAEQAFRRRDAGAALIVQPGFGEAIAAGRTGSVGVLVDGSQTTSARMAATYSAALNTSYSGELRAQWAQTHSPGGAPQIGVLEPRQRTWYNPDRKSSLFLIPGLVAVIIMIVTVQQTATSLVREREQGTREQMLVSPMRSWELIVGKLTPWTVMAFIDIAVIVAIGMWWFDLPFRGSPLVLAVGSLLFIASALSIGLIISAVAPSMDVANIVSILIAFLPAFLLSGFAFPLPSIPVVLQWISYLFPGRYMVDLSRAVFLKGAGFAQSWPDLLSLAAYLAVLLTVASVLSRRRVS